MEAEYSLANVLELIQPYVDPALAAPERLDCAIAAMRDVPANRSRCLYLECRLAPEASALDVAFLLHTSGTSDRECVPTWIERDLGSASLPPVAPSDHAILDLVAICNNATSDEALAATVVDTLISFLGQSTIAIRCAHVLALLPAHARLAYVGDMRQRTEPSVRLCVGGLSNIEVLDTLAAVAWPGDINAVAAVLEQVRCVGQERPALVHLDMGDQLAPRIGLEFPLARAPQLEGLLAEQPLFDVLQRAGVCSRDKRLGLERFCGFEVRALPHELWPSILVRRVNHVKLVVDANAAPSAKAYLCLEIHLRRRNRLPTL